MKLLLKNYSGKKLCLILSYFYLVDKEVTINTIKLIINEENWDFFFEIEPFKGKDIFGWNVENYLNWNKRKVNINYLLIFSY